MNRRDFLVKASFTAISAAMLKSSNVCADQTTPKPNFIFILSDDQNWNGLSVRMDPSQELSRDRYVETPNIARLAQQSMRFTQAYAPAPVCSPTRISIQTGKSPAQLHWTKAAPNVDPAEGYKLIAPQSKRRIPPTEQTIAELLKTAGYTTAHYGKWHLSGGGPGSHGYDESDGDTSNKDAAPFKAPNPVDIFGMGKRAADFMAKSTRTKKPFYIQLSYHALHYPENATPKTVAKYRKKMPNAKVKEILRCAIAEDLDSGIGVLLKNIDQLGLAENTYVIYMSDNGGGGGKKHRLLQGGKGSLMEGGIRVPFIIRGPGIKANSFCDTPIVGYDLLPTFCKLAGVKQTISKKIEGGDISHLLKGSSEKVKRRFPGLAFHFPHYQGQSPQSALRYGDYKIVQYYEDSSINLFNLDDDPSEMNDLSIKLPDKTSELKRLLNDYLTSVNAQLPKTNPAYVPGKTFNKNKNTKEQKKAKQPKKRRRQL